MNITCDSCQARYTIPDEKVTGEGRVFKVPCKQCGAEIVVQGIPESEATPAVTTPAADAWYYAVGQDRQGPVSRENLAALIGSGTITSATYVWCDGMEDWSVLGDVDELQGLLSQGAAASTPDESSANEGGADPAPASEATAASESTENAAEEQASSEDLFSFETTDKAPRSSVHGRRDSSVLFSLDELSSFEEPREQDPQSFLTETSGLIDIRGLANSHQSQADDADNPFLSATGGTSSSKPAFSLSYVPVVAKKKSPWPWVVGIAAVIAIGIGVTLALVGGDDTEAAQSEGDRDLAANVGKDDTSATTNNAGTNSQANSPSAPADKGKKSEEVKLTDSEGKKVAAVNLNTDVKDQKAPGGEGSTQAEKAAAEPRAKTPPKVSPSARKSTSKSVRTPTRKAAAKATAKKPVAAKPAPATKPPAPKEPPVDRKASKGVNDLLNSLSGKQTSKKTAGAGGGSGPKTLTSSTVRSKVRGRNSRFKSCYKMQPNRPATGVSVTLKFTIKNTGSVGSARVNGGGLTGGVQSCILRALKSIRFPVFRDAEKRVTYPLRLL